jgi:hypothetical protein
MTMTRLVALAAVTLLVLAGCAHQDPKPAVCDGKHRRPANPYGSVLPNISDGSAARPSAGVPPPVPAPGPTSSIDRQSNFDPRSFAPCGDGA